MKERKIVTFGGNYDFKNVFFDNSKLYGNGIYFIFRGEKLGMNIEWQWMDKVLWNIITAGESKAGAGSS